LTFDEPVEEVLVESWWKIRPLKLWHQSPNVNTGKFLFQLLALLWVYGLSEFVGEGKETLFLGLLDSWAASITSTSTHWR